MVDLPQQTAVAPRIEIPLHRRIRRKLLRQVSAWNALFAPKGTPQAVIDKLSAALGKALDDETTRKRLLDLGSDIPAGERRTPQALRALVKSEVARWTPILKAAGTN